MNTIIFGALAIISLFIFFNLGKVKASRKQLDRSNRVNRFGNQEPNNIIEGEAKEINEDDNQKIHKNIIFLFTDNFDIKSIFC